ncbi:Phosphatidylinositol-3-phosphatase [Mycobacterium simulans]|uniref:Phosphatidylinositol-3-phosphatase n=1 Tax=Mycobacterium simulans TaxID=627089 RepID=A0A7Z7NB66_9MYCO|nr:alkaline phosphatase family protein [Mycobacterium simulans]SOJ56581.1 Phosphatidylinositol-3-phosphatase [Mycobacterium simulans]
MSNGFRRATSALISIIALMLPSATAPVSATSVQSPNLLINPGAEFGDPSLSGYGSVTVPGWTVTGTPTAIKYGTRARPPSPWAWPAPTLPAALGFPNSSSGPPDGGVQFFGGGNVATSTLTQAVDLSRAARQIDTRAVPYSLSGWFGGYLTDPSAASATVDFLGASGQRLGGGKVGPVTVGDRWLKTVLLKRETSGTIPAGTRSAVVVVTFTDNNPVPGSYNDAYADNLSFTVGAPLPAPPPPTPPVSTVGALDHVFMIYFENHGVTDIVGSPNAPYINSLISTYGYGSNYYAATHPSDPNYTPILGGSDFGVNFNCPKDCYDEPNLADNIEAAGKTWAGYAQSMPAPCTRVPGVGYATDELPFLAFHNIFSDIPRCQAHVLPLTRMATDLASVATTPNFVWWAANESYNMEGDNPVLFALSQIGDHQYDVTAGDTLLADTLPTILNSPAFQTRRCAGFITWDEDYDNLSLGIDNQGNHIPMIVIPSPNSGMRQGHFVAPNYNNHYSLLRTVEDALQLPRLTQNDRFAQPMNQYWP